MKFRLHSLHMTWLAALGLDLACVVPPMGGDSTGSESGSGNGESMGSESGPGDGDGEPPDPFTCANPQPILQTSSAMPTGFVQCAGGFVHREAKVDAIDPQGPDDSQCADQAGDCQTAADCVDDTFGRCIVDPKNGCECNYGCATDADCNPGTICAPSGAAGNRTTCIYALCTIDDECGDGLCGRAKYDGCCEPSFMTACADPVEACHVDSECTSAPCPDIMTANSQWQCTVGGQFNPNLDWHCEPSASCYCDC